MSSNDDDNESVWIGVIGVVVASCFWGSNFVVCKGYDGMPAVHFAFCMSIGIVLVGAVTQDFFDREEEPSFTPETVPEPSHRRRSQHGRGRSADRVRDDNNGSLDMSELARVLSALQGAVDVLSRSTQESFTNMENAVSQLHSRLNSVETRLNTQSMGTESFYSTEPDVVDDDSDDEAMSNSGQ